MQEPKFDKILAEKREYYGHSEAAIEFAASEFNRQYLDWYLSHHIDANNIKSIVNDEISYRQYVHRMETVREKTGVYSKIKTRTEYFNKIA